MRKIDTNDRITVAVHGVKLVPSHAAAAGTKFYNQVLACDGFEYWLLETRGDA